MDTSLIDKLLCGVITISIPLLALPAVRSLLGVMGIGICTLGLSPWILEKDFNPDFSIALKAGVILAIPILISYEFISSLSKSLEILRGSQLAEQLFVQERGGPIEFGMFLFLGSYFLAYGGVEAVLTQASLFLSDRVPSSDFTGLSLQDVYRTVLKYSFPLAALGVCLELLSGVFQRVSKRNLFGPEFSSLRLPLAVLFLIGLLES